MVSENKASQGLKTNVIVCETRIQLRMVKKTETSSPVKREAQLGVREGSGHSVCVSQTSI